MPQRIVKTVLPVDGVFRFEATVRGEGSARSMRVAVPAAIVRGLVHVGWTGRWLDVEFNGRWFRAAVRPHPTSVMFALPRSIRGALEVGAHIELTIAPLDGPRAPRVRRVRGELKHASPTLALPWLR